MRYEQTWRDGPLGFVVGVVVVVIAGVLVIGGIMLTIKVALMEPGCNQRADELGVVDGDYRILSDTCYLTLSDGRKLPADQVRGVEGLRR